MIVSTTVDNDNWFNDYVPRSCWIHGNKPLKSNGKVQHTCKPNASPDKNTTMTTI